MRGLAILALCALMLLASLFVLGPPEKVELGSPAEVVADLRSRLASVTGDEAESADGGAASRAGQAGGQQTRSAPTFYRYTDDQGRIHFVQGPGDVPSRYRKDADTLEVTSELIRPEQPSAAPARPRQRAFAYDPAQEPQRHQGNAEVVIYTTTWCGWCRKTLAWLDARGVDYDNRDIESDPRAREELIAKTGSTSIPVVEVDGRIIRGYSPGKMQRLLEL